MLKVSKLNQLPKFNMNIFTILVVLDTFSPGWAATYYIAKNGSDANPGTLEKPFATINKGCSVLTAGDTLYIRGGIYQMTVYESTDGTASRRITQC